MSSIFMRFPDGRKKSVTLSYDDGVEQDIRLIKIMNDAGLKGTFNLNSGCFKNPETVYESGRIHRRMSKEDCVKLYKNSGHEVAVHSLTHPFLEQLSDSMLAYEILEDRKNLEELFDTVVRGMAYPFGTYNDRVTETLKNLGIAYSRTVHSTEKFDIPQDWLRLNPTCHHNNGHLTELVDSFLTGEAKHAPWLFYMWGHSYEFEGNDNWDVIEKFADTIGGKKDIWYATNIEIYDYIQAYNKLRFSVRGNLVENPTATDLYFETNNELYMVKAGECLHLNTF